MANSVIHVENLSKQYRYGIIDHGALYRDLQSWWARFRGEEDPNSKVTTNAGPAKTGERFWALKDVSFEVEEGSVLAIIGRNGAGKSTLLKILSRVTLPTEGQVKIRGRIASLLEVGTGFHPDLTGRENVFLNGLILGMTKSEVIAKFDEIVDFSGIEKFIDTPVKRYSSGMKVRLGFAVAAHLQAEIMIVDEVLAVGDAEFRAKCLGKMKDVSEGGRTVLFVSHNMSAIRNLCHHAILLDRGRITDTGTADEVVDRYLGASFSEQHVNDDIGTQRHLHKNPQMEIYRIDLLDAKRKIVDAIEEKRDFYLRLYCKFNKTVTCKVAMRFLNELKVLIGRIPGTSDYYEFTGNQGNIFELEVKVKNVFVPGKHSIGIGVSSATNTQIDRIDDIFFEVLQKDKMATQKGGIVQIESDWEIAKKIV